jgi:hypothetical protein
MVEPKIILIDDGKTDFWNRKLYRSLYSGVLYVAVDGIIHSMTEEGEPFAPIKYKEGEIIFKNNSY